MFHYKLNKTLLLLTVLCSLLFALCHLNLSSAHPQPLVVQEFIFNFEKTNVKIDYKLRIDPVVLDNIYKIIDKNNDSFISNEEIDDYANNFIIKNSTGRLNNRDIKLIKTGQKLLKKSDFQSLEDHILINFQLENPKVLETSTFFFKYSKRFLPDDPYGDQFVFDDNTFNNPEIERLPSNLTKEIVADEYSVDIKYTKSAAVTLIPTTTGKLIEEQKQVGNKSVFEQIREKSTELSGKARNYNFKESSPGFIILGLIIVFIAGALHAITPGHGKSMMAAFLIGKRKSRISDVLVLALSITLAHTFVIYIIGFVLLQLQMTSIAPTVAYYAEKLGSILLLIFGFILLRNAYKAYTHHQYHKKMGEDHHHHHHHHEEKQTNIRSKWDLFYVGISGGIIPCIDALSILFAAVQIGKVALGLVLIFVFSLGLASAITLLGLLLIFGKDKLNIEERLGGKVEIYFPLISGLFILVVAGIYLISK